MSVDYATFTVKAGPRAVTAWDYARKIQDSEETSGQFVKPWRGFAYLGWASSHITCGRRLDGCIFRLSGVLAQHFWRSFFSMSDNCSRLDVALTVRVEPVEHRIAHSSLREFRTWAKGHDSRIKHRLIDGGLDGSTVEIGSRASQQFGRIYDKHAESPRSFDQGAWRFEVEYKDEYALAVATQLYSSSDRDSAAGQLAAQFFRERGITVPGLATLQVARYKESKETVTAEDKLRYLSYSIKPLVRQLVMAVGEREVLDALGLWKDTSEGQMELPTMGEGVANNGSR